MIFMRISVMMLGALSILAMPSCRAQEGCPSFEDSVSLCTPENAALEELSGLLDSRQHPGVFWAHNDSGDAAQLYAFSRTGQHLGIYALDGITAVDWEDIAFGPGPDSERDYIYIGDFGNNGLYRSSLVIYRIPEPDADPLQEPQNVLVEEVESFPLVYPLAPLVVYDCETLLVDPVFGDIYLVTKDSSSPQVEDGLCHVFRKTAPHLPGEEAILEEAGTLFFAKGLSGMITAGDVSPAGDEILIRSYLMNRLWKRLPGEALHEALARDYCAVPMTFEIQGEAIAFAADGTGYYTASEAYTLGIQPVHFFERIPETEGEGVSEGIPEGELEGTLEGEGLAEGAQEGLEEGLPEGEEEGIPSEGSLEEGEGLAEGLPEGQEEGEGVPEGEGLLEGSLEGGLEGQEEGFAEGVEEGQNEGTEEGAIEGEEEGMPLEGSMEGSMEEGEEEGVPSEGLPEEGEGETDPWHSADRDHDNVIGLSELLRVIQFFNSGGYHCEEGTEDGYAPGSGDPACLPHDSDYNPQDWDINLSELLRIIQFFNSSGYHSCPEVFPPTEDGFCVGIGE